MKVYIPTAGGSGAEVGGIGAEVDGTGTEVVGPVKIRISYHNDIKN